jgi:hypothetical protein
MASHILIFTVAMNVLTGHATCFLVFGVVGLVISLIFSLPRTMKNMSWLSLACEYSDFLWRVPADQIQRSLVFSAL